MDSSGEASLFEAVRGGDSGKVKALLVGGVAVDAVDDLGRTPLMIAVLGESERVVAVLLEYGADPRATDSRGFTPLMMSVEYPRPEVVRMLLRSGAGVNALSKDGRSALLNAVWSADSTSQVVEVLLAAGADVMVTDASYGMTPREWAEAAGDGLTVELLANAEAGGQK